MNGGVEFRLYILVAFLTLVDVVFGSPSPTVSSRYQGLGSAHVGVEDARLVDGACLIASTTMNGGGRVLLDPLLTVIDAEGSLVDHPLTLSDTPLRFGSSKVFYRDWNKTLPDPHEGDKEKQCALISSALLLLVDHFSGVNPHGVSSRDKVVVNIDQKFSVQSDTVHHSSDGGKSPTWFNPQRPQKFHFGDFHTVSGVVERRSRAFLFEVTFFTPSLHHEPPVQRVRVGYGVKGVERALKGAQLRLPAALTIKAKQLRSGQEKRKDTSIRGVPSTSSTNKQVAANCDEDQNLVLPSPGARIFKNQEEKTISPRLLADFRFLNFNVWNYNGDWAWRSSRLALLMRKADPSLAVLQEIRIDHTFDVFANNVKLIQSDAQRLRREFTLHGYAQSAHLMRQIRNKVPMWFDFVPGMVYWNRDDHTHAPRFQIEGPMVAVRSVSPRFGGGGERNNTNPSRHESSSCSSPPIRGVRIIDTIPFYLSRIPGHPQDDHQRVLLCSVVRVPVGYTDDTSKTVEKNNVRCDENKKGEEEEDIRIDFCTIHFTLAAEPQLRNAEESVRNIQEMAKCQTIDCLRSLVPNHGNSRASQQKKNSFSWRQTSSRWTRSSLKDDDSHLLFSDDEGRNTRLPPLALSVLAGDLNAEPHDRSIRYLMENGPFNDSWVHHKVAMRGRRSGGSSSADQSGDKKKREVDEVEEQLQFNSGLPGDWNLTKREEQEGFTFNSQSEKLVKRIDFILTKTYEIFGDESADGQSHSSMKKGQVSVEVPTFELLGQRGAKGAPPPASDHLGILSRLRLWLN